MTAVAATGVSSREARRRRIIERGSDRLALITGRIQSLPPDPDQSRSSSIQPAADNPPQHQDYTSSLPNQEPSREPGQQCILDDTTEPWQQKIDKSHDTRKEPTQISRGQSLTTGQISSAISASENIRMCFSLAAAVLVILSYIGFPRQNIIIFRPVYLLLLTNISTVVGRVLLGSGRRGNGRVVGGKSQLGKALEVGLMLQKIAKAMFMDFSVYVVVLVFGLSLLRGLY